MSNFTSDLLSNEEKRRFDRQFRLPGWNQEILKNSTVLICGVGGLGVEVAKNLAMVGVGKLILVDLDTIEYSNLNRQILFINAPAGAPKAEIAAKRLKEMNPFINIDFYCCPLQDIPPKVSIDEAVEIGKKFGTEDSGSFINGILDNIYNTLVQEARLRKKEQ